MGGSRTGSAPSPLCPPPRAPLHAPPSPCIPPCPMPAATRRPPHADTALTAGEGAGGGAHCPSLPQSHPRGPQSRSCRLSSGFNVWGGDSRARPPPRCVPPPAVLPAAAPTYFPPTPSGSRETPQSRCSSGCAPTHPDCVHQLTPVCPPRASVSPLPTGSSWTRTPSPNLTHVSGAGGGFGGPGGPSAEQHHLCPQCVSSTPRDRTPSSGGR